MNKGRNSVGNILDFVYLYTQWYGSNKRQHKTSFIVLQAIFQKYRHSDVLILYNNKYKLYNF